MRPIMNTPYDYDCDSGNCPRVKTVGDTVTITEDTNPGPEVVTTLAGWDGYLDTVRKPLLARIAELEAAVAELTPAKPRVQVHIDPPQPQPSFGAGFRAGYEQGRRRG